MFIEYFDRVCCDFTRDLNSYLSEPCKSIIDIREMIGFYLYKPDIQDKCEWIAIRFPGATRGGIKINYSTHIIEDIGFIPDTFFGLVENSFDEKAFKDKWIGKKLG